jgi:hypothetical protein
MPKSPLRPMKYVVLPEVLPQRLPPLPFRNGVWFSIHLSIKNQEKFLPCENCVKIKSNKMGKNKQKINAKGRQQVDTIIDNSATNKVQKKPIF